MNLLEIIEERCKYPLGEEDDFKYLQSIDLKKSPYLVIPEYYFHNAYKKNPDFLQGYYISAIFDIAELYSPGVALRFSLYALSDNKPEFVKVSTYKNSIYINEIIPRTVDSENRIFLQQPQSYPDEYVYYLDCLEKWINDNNVPRDSFAFCFNIVSYMKFVISEAFSARYSSFSMKVHDKLKKENTVSLKELADIIEPVDNFVMEPVEYLWSPTQFKYPYEESYFRKGRVHNIQLKKGDILFCSGGEELQINYFYKDYTKRSFYCPALTTIIRPKEGVSPDYLFLYLTSDTAKCIIGPIIQGMVIQKLSKEEIESLPIIPPQKSNSSYKRFFKECFLNNTNRLDMFSSMYKQSSNDTIEDLLNEELRQKVTQIYHKEVESLIQSDIDEIISCYQAKAYKATLILAGSVLEAFLIDWLSELEKTDYFKITKYVVDQNGSSKKADLKDYIDQIEFIKTPDWMKEAEKAHNIRCYRNKVHAKLCLSEKEKINASLCKKVINYLCEIIGTRYNITNISIS